MKRLATLIIVAVVILSAAYAVRSVEAQDGIDSSPTIVGDVVYIVGGDGWLYALDAATGEEKWWLAAREGTAVSSPTIVGDVVYVVGGDGWLYALDAATGDEKWSIFR